MLLTRRSMGLRNHRGEISFPGGRLDEGETYEQAALREAFEEVALPPASVDVVGRLLPLSTVVSLSYIVPVVAVLGTDPELRPAAAEVDRIFWEPLADLLVDGTYREERWGTPPLDRPIFFFELDDETVWGATRACSTSCCASPTASPARSPTRSEWSGLASASLGLLPPV